ncbi:protein-glutamate O-methyltransferase CheR [Methylobacter sp.]|uniref:CheR family methyltransferase n=1 Tax=Methylobacter sp. TaxID=2051955 RepID=UPI002488D443|nr:protein-glutamate O-methyltransferase CheR [Methylobacter sp.]MDI1276171.1 protein-glutamate O-methyltransferase CheR [Methylobacter sp.]MDI1356941.1 protein-glutamate O-methyltransferase CheR [Methylobacter sp.]
MKKITAYSNHKPNFAAVVLQDKEFALFRELIYSIAGISMSPAKKPLVTSRLAKRLKHYELASYGEYFQLITATDGKAELQIAVDLLTTNETHFFREPKHFDFLRERILPDRKPGKPLRIWSAACSSGEEPYSIAMVLYDVLGNAPWEIVASDLSTRVLEKARGGLYPMERVPEIPRHYLSNYCLKGTGTQEGTLLIERKLRERVQFMQHNLTEAPPKLGEFDAIFLRNVMIYFDQDTKRQVVSRLLSLLRPGGHFLVGHSETLNGITDSMRLVQPSVYLKP